MSFDRNSMLNYQILRPLTFNKQFFCLYVKGDAGIGNDFEIYYLSSDLKVIKYSFQLILINKN
jgi:hypothetical protein